MKGFKTMSKNTVLIMLASACVTAALAGFIALSSVRGAFMSRPTKLAVVLGSAAAAFVIVAFVFWFAANLFVEDKRRN